MGNIELTVWSFIGMLDDITKKLSTEAQKGSSKSKKAYLAD